MSALPEPADLAPSRDPAVYGRARILSPTFWAMMGLCVLCILAGMAIVSFAPRLWPARTTPAAAPPPIAEPAESAAAAPEAPPSAVTSAAPAQVADLDSRVRRLEGDQQRTVAAAAETIAAALHRPRPPRGPALSPTTFSPPSACCRPRLTSSR